MKKVLLTTLAMILTLTVQAELRLPQLFQTGMVLQRHKTIPVWGKADAHEKVTILFGKKQFATTADGKGDWRIDLPAMKAGGPYSMEIKGEGQDRILLTDVMVGDVWLCSGQSNMDVTIERVYPQYAAEIDGYENNRVRLFRVENDTDTHGAKGDIRPTTVNWKTLNKRNGWGFSAVGYFLGKRMAEKTGVAQGIIVNSWGGTPIEAWISRDSLEGDYPMLIRRVAFYQNDRFVRAQTEANAEANNRWNELLEEADSAENYRQPSYPDREWTTIDQRDWTWRGIGSVWLRQHIQMDAAHAGKAARLLLGSLYDQDITYLNGREIGRTYYQYPPRRYDIPEGLLREGDNVIAVRMINKQGAAHFIPEKPYMIAFGDDRCSQNPMPQDVIRLSETWKCHTGAEMPACPSGDVSLQNLATTLYNAVVHPLAPYGINGVVWYQGESNTGNPAPYADYLKKLMGCWRDRWQDQQMAFVVVQLANYDGRQQTGFPQPITPQTEPTKSGWAELREAQRLAVKADGRAELAVINDLGETVDIHPLRKKEVAERIGLCLDRLIFNNKVKLSPEVIKAEIKDGKIVLTLDQDIQPGELYSFEVAGEDGIFHNVGAIGKGNVITLTAHGDRHLILRRASYQQSQSPCAVRYAWKDNPLQANVRGLSGLPMSSFEINVKM